MQVNLNLSDVSTQSSRVVVPTGVYGMKVVGAEVKETAAKTGYYIQLALMVVGGDHDGVSLTERLNINNPNQDATRIGLSQLKTIMTVGGHNNPNALSDTDELIGLQFNAYVEENPHSFTGKDGDIVETTQNEIKSYFEFDASKVKSQPKTEAKPTTTAAPTAAPTPAPTPVATQAPTQPAQTAQVAENEAAPAAAAGAFPWMTK